MFIACGALTADPLPARGHVSGSEQRQRRHSQAHATSASTDAVQQGIAPQAGEQAWRAGAVEGSAGLCCSSSGSGGGSSRHRQRLLTAGSSWQCQRGVQPFYDQRLASMSARFISITGLQVDTSTTIRLTASTVRSITFTGQVSRLLAPGCRLPESATMQ